MVECVCVGVGETGKENSFFNVPKNSFALSRLALRQGSFPLNLLFYIQEATDNWT